MSWSWKAENDGTASWSDLFSARALNIFERTCCLSKVLNVAMTFGNALQVGSCGLQQFHLQLYKVSHLFGWHKKK